MSNYQGDLGDHFIIRKVKISRKIILPNVNGVDGLPESFTVNRCPLACISQHVLQVVMGFFLWERFSFYFHIWLKNRLNIYL
jgi:hypothetical protein